MCCEHCFIYCVLYCHIFCAMGLCQGHCCFIYCMLCTAIRFVSWALLLHIRIICCVLQPYCVVSCGHCHLVPRVLLFHLWHQVSDNIEGTATPYIKFLSWALSLCSKGTVALYVYFSCRYFVCCVLMTCFGYGYWCFIFHIWYNSHLS